MCGVLGLFGPTNSRIAAQMYDGLIALQHRGQDAAGITTYDGRYHTAKGLGLVTQIFRQGDMDRLVGHLGVAHVRYPTFGNGTVEDAQPFVELHPFGIAMVHNGQVTNFRAVREELARESRRLVNSGCDVEYVLHVFADELSRAVPQQGEPNFDHVQTAVAGVHRRVKGAYSVVAIVAGLGMIAFRDPYGIRPLTMSVKDINGEPCVMFASESAALTAAGWHEHQDVQFGEVVMVGLDRTIQRATLPTAKAHRPCIFEYIYFARPDSLHDTISVYHSRVRLGEALADEWRKTGISVDVIVPVPDSARPAATEMAVSLGVKYREGLLKNRYIGRTFIMPQNENRKRAIRHKLSTVDLVFKGKDVLLIDDSIVRGNTIRELIQLVREAGARNVYFASYSAPLTHPCVYGIDMSTKGEFIAATKSIEEIKEEVGADFLMYQDFTNMVAATRQEEDDSPTFCTACFNGTYPTEDIGDDILADFAKDREKA